MAPLTVRCASIWAGDQYICAVRRPADRHRRSTRPRGRGRVPRSALAQVGQRLGSWPGRATRAASSAASGVTQGEIDVAKDLPRNGPSGTYSQAWMSRARPVVDQDDAEDVVGEGVDGDRRAESGADADDEAQLGLDVEPGSGRTSARHRGRLALPGRPDDVGARDDDGAGSAVVADGEVLPVRRQRFRVGPEEPSEVGCVVLGGVEVDVVGDLERQVQDDVTDRVHRGVRDSVGHQCRDALADLDPAGAALRHERVECRCGEGGVGPVRSEGGGEVDDGVADADADPGWCAGGGEHPVGEVVGAERRAVGDRGCGHPRAPCGTGAGARVNAAALVLPSSTGMSGPRWPGRPRPVPGVGRCRP